MGLWEDTIIADELVLEINKRFVSKDKIKAKIEELNNNYLVVVKAGDKIQAIQHNHDVDVEIQVLQELLEE